MLIHQSTTKNITRYITKPGVTQHKECQHLTLPNDVDESVFENNNP